MTQALGERTAAGAPAAARRSRREPTRRGPARLDVVRLDLVRLALAAISGGLVALGWALGWRGVDLPAQVYRVQQFRAHGFTLWDSQWYAGHWTLDYSVLYPPLAAWLGIGLLAALSAAAATAAFDRVLVDQLGPGARLGSAIFAVSVIVETSIGQLAFFTGEAFGLACLWVLVAGRRRRWILAALLGLASTLSSPLAGAFLALALAAWCLSAITPRRGAAGTGYAVGLAMLGALTLAPIGVTTLLFPGQGPMPYPVIDWLWETVVALVALAAAPRRLRVLRIGIGIYLVALLGSVAVPSALGGNIGRMEDTFALPVVAACCWVHRDVAPRAWLPVATRRATAVSRVALGLVAVPLVLSQWSPAWPALSSNAGASWTQRAYYTPVAAWLSRAVDVPTGAGGDVSAARVEVVPTLDHWEAAYVAPAVPLARGWERQLDLADDPLFYRAASLTPTSYRAWLEAEGVQYVALSAGPVDPAAVAEAHLVEAGVPGLRLVWRNANWRVYHVVGGPGIVSGPARLTAMQGDHVALAATAAGKVLVRIRWAAHWRLTSGAGHLVPATGGWTEVIAARPGAITLAAGW